MHERSGPRAREKGGAVSPDETDHAAHVDAWLAATTRNLAPAQQVALFERALVALWRRAEITLGEITLTAIMDRVLYTASETHPFLSTVTIEKAAISFEGFRAEAARHGTLREAVRLVLVDLLTVLGHLTDEILTPALHAELSKVTLKGPRATAGNKRIRGARS